MKGDSITSIVGNVFGCFGDTVKIIITITV